MVAPGCSGRPGYSIESKISRTLQITQVRDPRYSEVMRPLYRSLSLAFLLLGSSLCAGNAATLKWAANGDAKAPKYRKIAGQGKVEEIRDNAFAALSN